MIRQFYTLSLMLAALVIAGCGSAPKQQAPTISKPVVEAQPNPEILKALAQLDELKQELKQLRNSVEELQFETENSKRRQQDLFRDIDRRMVDLERNQSVLSPQIDKVNGTNTDGSSVQIVNGSSNGESVAADSANTTGNVAEVTIVGSTAATNTTENQSETVTHIDSSTPSVGAVSLEEQNLYEAAFNLLKQSRYEDSIQSFQQLVDTWPNSQLADDAYFWMSEARYVNREFEYALSGFRTVVSQFPDSQRVPEALLKIGYIQYDMGTYEEAADTFRDILARFPGHQVTVSAQTRLRRIEQTIQ